MVTDGVGSEINIISTSFFLIIYFSSEPFLILTPTISTLLLVSRRGGVWSLVLITFRELHFRTEILNKGNRVSKKCIIMSS